MIPDAGQPGGVTPVWGTAETLHLAAQAKLPDGQRSDPLLVAYGVHPEPGKPEAMACWQHDGQPCGDTFRFWPGYLEAYGLYDAYHVVDAFGNTVFGLTGASATQPGGGVDVDFTSQLSTGGSPQGFTLDVEWPTGASQPSGPFPVTLAVDVPADPAGDWPAATVSKAITLDFQGGETRMLIAKQSYDARFAADDGVMPMTVAPGAGEGGLPSSPAGDTPRLVLLAVRGTQVPWAIVGGSDEPSLEPDKVYRSQLGTWQKVQATPGSQDVVLDTQPGGTVRLSLVDGSFNVVPETAFRVHRCPRGEHLTEESPAPEPCTLGPVDSDAMTGILPSLELNAAGGARGYLGIELTKAPVDPGTYYVLVESTGATPYRIRQGADLVRRAGQDSEYLGAYAVCTVAGGEILDESFQRFPDGLVQVAQPSRLYLRVRTQPGTPPISAVLHATRQTGEVVETGVGITTAPLARSGYQVAPFVAIPEGNTEAVPSPDPPIHLATWFGRLEARTAGGGGAGASKLAGSGGSTADLSFLLAGADSVTPVALYARFLRRGCYQYQPPPAVVDVDACLTAPLDGNPDHAGQVQETDIVKLTGGAGLRDYYMEKVDILIDARRPSLPGMPLGPRVDVAGDLFLQEIPNTDYDDNAAIDHRRLFFDRYRYSSEIDATTGTLAGPMGSPPETVSLRGGVAVMSLYSVALPRFDANSPGTVLTGTPYQAHLEATLSGPPLCLLCSTSTGPVEVRQWVDERTYARNGSGLAWVSRLTDFPAPDWLEARALDYLVNPEMALHAEAAEVFSRVEHIKVDWSIGWADGKVLLNAPNTVLLRPAQWFMRFPYHLDWETSQTPYHGLERLFERRWLFENLLSHEARHSWQLTLRTAGGRSDLDEDFLPTNPPDSARVLTDAAFDPTGVAPGLNPEFAFLGDTARIPGQTVSPTNDLVNSRPSWNKAVEHDADRFAAENLGGSTSCLAFSWQGVAASTSPEGPSAITGRLDHPIQTGHPTSELAGFLVSVEQATTGTTCSDAGGWSSIARTPTTDGGNVVVGLQAGRYRLRLEPPWKECRTTVYASPCVVIP